MIMGDSKEEDEVEEEAERDHVSVFNSPIRI